MPTIIDIYKHYNIMPTLQLHQLRVAAVGMYIAEHLDQSVQRDDIATALLLHDMGNIIKFDFRIFPDFCEPEGVAYWESIQKKFRLRYGHNEHEAHLHIARELHMPDHIVHYIDAVGFSMMNDTRDADSWEQKICAYADQRVGPFGVIDLKDRLEEGRKRYRISDADVRMDLVESVCAIENEINNHMSTSVHVIDDASIEKYFDFLKGLELSVQLPEKIV